MDFANDGDSTASGSKSLQTKAYGAMQTRIKDAKNKKEQARATRGKAKAVKPTNGLTNTKKRVRKKTSTSGSQGSVEKNDEKGWSLTHLLAQALQAVEHFEENNYPKKSDCTALGPMAKNLAKVYVDCTSPAPH